MSSLISQWVDTLSYKQDMGIQSTGILQLSQITLWGCAQALHPLKDTENNLELLIRDRRQKNLNSLRTKIIMKNSKAGWFLNSKEF